MRQMQAVLWTKGVLLSPQHLQTQDRFLEDLLDFQLTALTFNPWGFHRLDIDREALAGGAFAISRASGLFPDGLLFDIPESDAGPPPKPLEGVWGPDQQTLDVYLAIPEYRYGGINVSASHGDRDTRYVAAALTRRDENTGLAERPIQVARKNFRLLVEGESLEGSSVLRAARLVKSPTGEIRLDPQYVPPLIDIQASEYLLSLARRLVEILSAKSTALSATRREKNQSLADFSLSDVANFWLLYTINTHLPQLRHIFETRRGHPVELYNAMTALAGALTTFSNTLHPRALPTYDHTDLGTCFTDLDAKVRQLLETVVPTNYVSLPLRLVQPSLYAVAIDQDRYFSAPYWYLAVSADVGPAELAQHTPALLKVSSADRLERLVKQALPGITMTYVAQPPTAIPVKVKCSYFQLTQAGTEWDAVKVARNLAAYVPAQLPNAALELVIIVPGQ